MSGNRRDSTNVRTVGEEPPYLTVGTEVSAKYRGAFCEANIKSVKKMVKCKVILEKGNGSSTVTDDCIHGELKVGSDVDIKLPDGQDVTGTLVKITDSSAYTVVFDDGDERTLKRTALCLKGEKHFNESETLDHLPLTDPENFGTPVMQQGKKSRKGSRRHSTSADESKEADEMPVRKKLMQNEECSDKVVMVDITEKKKSFFLPALRVSFVGSLYGELKSPENVLVRSFKDGKYIEVHPKDVKEFSKESAINCISKGDSSPLKLAVEHALKYLETKQLPSDWEEPGSKPNEIAKDCNSHLSSDEESEVDDKERNEFMADLTKFLEEKGTPLVRCPVLGHRDLDLYKLFSIVSEMDGMDNITSWQSVYLKMDIPVMTTTASYHIKNAYKRYLFDYEQHQREKEGKKTQADGKKCGKSEKSCNKRTVAASPSTTAKQKEEAQSKSDSDKDSRELHLFDENKLASHGRPSRPRRPKRTNRNKSLKSPNSPKLSPRSPCSPRSISSLSASGSAGCPSPSDNLCDSRELRTVVSEGACCDSSKNHENLCKERNEISGKDASKDKDRDLCTKVEDVRRTPSDITRNSKERACKSNSRNCKETGSDVEHINEDLRAGELDEKKDGLKKYAKNDIKLKKDDVEKRDVKKDAIKDEGKRVNTKKENGTKRDTRKEDPKKDDNKKQDMKKEVVKRPSEEVETIERIEDDDPGDGEDAVDVVNSPSVTSESVDGDERDDKKAEKSGSHRDEKTETVGKNGIKDQPMSNDGTKLEYVISDQICVRYGRGRNATIYHAKITAVDPYAEEGLYYLVHYAGWNARHDEWIGQERILGRGQKQTRTRNGKEPTKNNKPTPKPTGKPTPKPVAKKNGKNGGTEKQSGRSAAIKGRKRTPSPTVNMSHGRNGNGRTSKTRGEKVTVDSLDLADVKSQPRVTRRNSLTTPTEPPDSNWTTPKEQEHKKQGGKAPSSPPRSNSGAGQMSPKPQAEKPADLTSENELLSMEIDEEPTIAEAKPEEDTKGSKSSETGEDKGASEKEDLKVNTETVLKRLREDEPDDSPPAKKKHEEDDACENVFEEDKTSDCVKETSNPVSSEPEPIPDEANTPDLTCSEQLSTNCVSPDPYTDDYPRNNGFFGNGIGGRAHGKETKEKDSSSSLDEAKPEKTTNRKAKGRRDRKARAPSSQSSCEGNECPNTSSNGTSGGSLLPPPSWTPKYNFTENLEELLKTEESSERIRILQEKIKDIRKVYGELKSEVANIDRKRKRRQKRKREEELSAEESTTRSPLRSSPLSTSNAVAASSTLAPVECR